MTSALAIVPEPTPAACVSSFVVALRPPALRRPPATAHVYGRALLVMESWDIGPDLRDALLAEGLLASACAPDADVVQVLHQWLPRIVLVGHWLSDAVALTLCRQLHDLARGHLPLAVIVVGAGDDGELAIARALDAGADDYVSDVRRLVELRARVRCQLRRQRGA